MVDAAERVRHAAGFRRCLEAGDANAARLLWKYVFPALPQPTSDLEALATLHAARTAARSILFKLRAYSHRWLVDNGYPSAMPDELKPKAERVYPRVTAAVGISVNTKSEILKPITGLVRAAMEDAVLEAHADGKLGDSAFVKVRMFEAKDRIIKQLVGSLGK